MSNLDLYVQPPSFFYSPSSLMDSFYIDPSAQDSRHSRSRSNSHLSTTATQLQGLNIFDSSDPRGAQSLIQPTATHPQIPASFPHQEKKPPSSISAPVPQQVTPFPLLTQDELDWTFNHAEDSRGHTPLLRLDPAHTNEPSERRPSFHSNPASANMR